MCVAILCSGKGTDVFNLYHWIDQGELKDTFLTIAITDQPCVASELCKSLKINTVKISNKTAIFNILQRHKIDLVIMSGFMTILPKKVTNNYKVINIHPSYLPNLRGRDPQRKALHLGYTETGVTLHYATNKIDDDRTIISQIKTSILSNDTELTLSYRLQILGSMLLLKFLKRYEETQSR